MQQKNLQDQLFEIIQSGYRRSYELWGPTLMRVLDVQMNGYEWALSTGDPDLRKRAAYHRRMAMQGYSFLPACTELAPNGFVRRWLREVGHRYERLFGPPATAQRLVSALVLESAKHERKMRRETGSDRHAKIPPNRGIRFEFAGSERCRPGERPWTSTNLDADADYQRFRRTHNVISAAGRPLVEAARLYDRLVRKTRVEPEVLDEATRVIRGFFVPIEP